jgi:hypothetical protein
MTRRDEERLAAILDAIVAISNHLKRGDLTARDATQVT